MSVKFKVGFTINAETLFGIIAKFLPVDDLHVEEVPPAEPIRLAKVARLAAAAAGHAEAFIEVGGTKEASLAGAKRKRANRALNLNAGVNAAILGVLADGQLHRYRDLQDACAAAGYSRSGLGSRLVRLRQHGVAERVGDGSWRLVEARKTA